MTRQTRGSCGDSMPSATSLILWSEKSMALFYRYVSKPRFWMSADGQATRTLLVVCLLCGEMCDWFGQARRFRMCCLAICRVALLCARTGFVLRFVTHREAPSFPKQKHFFPSFAFAYRDERQ